MFCATHGGYSAHSFWSFQSHCLFKLREVIEYCWAGLVLSASGTKRNLTLEKFKQRRKSRLLTITVFLTGNLDNKQKGSETVFPDGNFHEAEDTTQQDAERLHM